MTEAVDCHGTVLYIVFFGIFESNTAYPRGLPKTTRSGLFPAMKSSNEGPELKVSENVGLETEGAEGVAKNRAPARRSATRAENTGFIVLARKSGTVLSIW